MNLPKLPGPMESPGGPREMLHLQHAEAAELLDVYKGVAWFLQKLRLFRGFWPLEPSCMKSHVGNDNLSTK